MSERRPSRRAVLSLLPAAMAGAVGCTPSDPRINRGPGSAGPGPAVSATGGAPAPPGSASPGAPGGSGTAFLAAAAAEVRAARHIAVVLTAASLKLTGRQRAFLSGLRELHLDHAAVLLSPDPAARRPGARPPDDTTATVGLPARLSALRRTELALATRHDAAAARAHGSSALIYSSLAEGARSYAVAVADPTPPEMSRAAGTAALTVVSDVVAQQAVVDQTYALIFGYQVALGRLPVGSADRTRAAAALVARRTLRDRLIRQLLDRNADIPVAEAGYRLPFPVESAVDARRLIRDMETALLPWVGQWVVAAAQPEDRRSALRTLTDISTAATAWGAAPRRWPGWP